MMTMRLELKRTYRGPEYTIGKLYVNGSYFCDTLENKDRGLSCQLRECENIRLKVLNKTAIPTGEYHIAMDIVSSRFRYKDWARPYNGKLPRLLSVPAFEGVLIHPGNTQDDTSGCLLVGENKVKGKVINSVATFHRLMEVLTKTSEYITIKIS